MRVADIGNMLVNLEEDGSAKNRMVNALLVGVLAEAERNPSCLCTTCEAAGELGKWLSSVLFDEAPEYTGASEYRGPRGIEEGPSL